MRRECQERFPRHRGLAIPTCTSSPVTYVPWCMLGLLTSGFVWSPWRRERSRRMRMSNPQLYVSSKRPIAHVCPNIIMLVYIWWHGSGNTCLHEKGQVNWPVQKHDKTHQRQNPVLCICSLVWVGNSNGGIFVSSYQIPVRLTEFNILKS